MAATNRDHHRMMYFGTPGAMTWVPCPQVDRPSSIQNWVEETPLLNGGLHVRRSFGGHRVFEMTWSGISPEQAQVLEGYYAGSYGDGLIYWNDPMSRDKNVLPTWFSTPALGAKGAPPLGVGGAKPLLSTAPPTSKQGLPPLIADFDITANEGRRVWLPVPDDHDAWLYWRGYSTGGVGLVVGEASADHSTMISRLGIVPQDPTGVQTVAFTQFSPATRNGIFLAFGSQTALASGTASVLDVGVQILPLGRDPDPVDATIPGMGAGGCIVTEFEKTDRSAAFGKVNVTMVLKEVGPWR